MAVETQTAAKTQTSVLQRVGLIGTITAGVVFAIPVLYTLYAQLTGNVSLSSADQITNLFKYGILLCIVALVLGVIALVLGASGLLRAPRRGIVQTAVSVLLLILTAVFLFAMVLPRASAVQTLNDKVVPFALSMRDNCRTTLNAVTPDLAKARDDATQHLTDDAGFAIAMQADAAKLTADVQALRTSLPKLQAATVPLTRFQQLKDDCVTGAQGEADFLANSKGANAIPLPAPYNAIQATISPIDLIQLSAAEATGTGPVKLPPNTIEGLVSVALAQVITLSSNSPFSQKLTGEGDDLTQYISDTLTNNLAPFKSTIPVQ
jgi:hypothetical protein